jgi:hypothetical protein
MVGLFTMSKSDWENSLSEGCVEFNFKLLQYKTAKTGTADTLKLANTRLAENPKEAH